MYNSAHSAAQLLDLHFQTLVNDNQRWKELIADDIVWELPYAPALGHPASLDGRAAVERHVGWFLSAVENFRFHDLRIVPGSDPDTAVGEIRAEGLIKATGRIYRQQYVVFLWSKEGKIVALREYFDPVIAAHALDEPLRNVEA